MDEYSRVVHITPGGLLIMPDADGKEMQTGLPLSLATMDNLKQKREQTKEINILRGLPENAPINISMDVRYNSTTVKNSYGAGQAASQAIQAAIEWQTDQHQIVGFHLENKLCKVGSMLRSQGHNVTCPGHERCSATLRSMTLAKR